MHSGNGILARVLPLTCMAADARGNSYWKFKLISGLSTEWVVWGLVASVAKLMRLHNAHWIRMVSSKLDCWAEICWLVDFGWKHVKCYWKLSPDCSRNVLKLLFDSWSDNAQCIAFLISYNPRILTKLGGLSLFDGNLNILRTNHHVDDVKSAL